MAIPKISKESILKVIEFIDKNSIIEKYKSKKYLLVMENGKEYPPKYVIAVADYIENKNEITTEKFTIQDAKRFLERNDFRIIKKEEGNNIMEFIITITADRITSTDKRFNINNLELGNYYKPTDTYFEDKAGNIIKRNHMKREYKISNMTMARIAFQMYEKEIRSLSKDEKINFPVCKYNKKSEMLKGIFPSVEDFKNYKNSEEYLTYKSSDGELFVIYSWNIFSTIIFVQECLKRFGNSGDKFILKIL